MFCGSGRGKFTRSTESFTEQAGEVEARGFHGARRKEWKTRRGGGRTEESRKHGGFMDHGERSGKHGVFTGGILEDAQFYSILLCFYEAGKAHDYIFFLAGSLKVS